jgi:hypothetical protein
MTSRPRADWWATWPVEIRELYQRIVGTGDDALGACEHLYGLMTLRENPALSLAAFQAVYELGDEQFKAKTRKLAFEILSQSAPAIIVALTRKAAAGEPGAAELVDVLLRALPNMPKTVKT